MRARLGLAAAVLAVGAFGPMGAANAVCIEAWEDLTGQCSPCNTVDRVFDRFGVPAMTQCLA